MKFLILACLVLSAMAEPEPQHETVGFTKHLNGAVVPVDTTSVLQQKALHGAAHATAAVNGFKFPFYVRPAVAPVVPTVKAVPYTYPFTYGLQYPYPYGPHHPVYVRPAVAPIVKAVYQSPENVFLDSAVNQIKSVPQTYAYSECIHQCSSDDTCKTEARWKVGSRTKWAQGSCFSPRFGGTCTGIPDPCESCRSVCGNRNGCYTTSLKYGESVESGAGSSCSKIGNGPQSATGSTSGSRAKCNIVCQSNGGCEVDSRWKEGSRTKWAQGSCFPPDFGGQCSGLPDPCGSCIQDCKGRKGESFTIDGLF